MILKVFSSLSDSVMLWKGPPSPLTLQTVTAQQLCSQQCAPSHLHSHMSPAGPRGSEAELLHPCACTRTCIHTPAHTLWANARACARTPVMKALGHSCSPIPRCGLLRDSSFGRCGVNPEPQSEGHSSCALQMEDVPGAKARLSQTAQGWRSWAGRGHAEQRPLPWDLQHCTRAQGAALRHSSLRTPGSAPEPRVGYGGPGTVMGVLSGTLGGCEIPGGSWNG